MSRIVSALRREREGRARARAKAESESLFAPKRPYPVGTRKARRHLVKASVVRRSPAPGPRLVSDGTLAKCVAHCHEPRKQGPPRPLTRARRKALDRAASLAS